MTQAPLDWIQQIENTLIDTKIIPLSGYAPSFPWEEFSKEIGALFQYTDLKISIKQMKILSGEAISQGFGTNIIPLYLHLTPLEGTIFFLMGKEEINELTTLALTQSHVNKGFLSSSFKEGFYYYICTEVALKLTELKAFGDLSIKLGKEAPLPQEESLCIDIEILHSKASFFARIVAPASFHKAFKEHFHEKRPLSFNTPAAKRTPVYTAVTIGQTELSITQWKNIHVGDFIALDQCTFDPQTKKGTAFLCLENSPILRLRIKEDHLKIVNYATYHEEKHSMDPKIPESDEHFDESQEFSSAEVNAETDEGHLWSSDLTKADLQEDELTLTAQIPLTLVIAVARLQMPLEELLSLSPGNTLELPVKPQQGVDITIQGKKVAKAELIKLGEMLGVKILRLADN